MHQKFPASVVSGSLADRAPPPHPLLQGQANSLHSQIGEIQERRALADRARQGDKAFLQLRQAQQMAAMVGRKKDELGTKMERLQVHEGGRAGEGWAPRWRLQVWGGLGTGEGREVAGCQVAKRAQVHW